jgi:glycosyltransferase involved in cell wall biosynthesis
LTAPVLHVASGREWRGGQAQVLLLARELQRQGLEQVVLTGRGTELARRLRDAAVPVREVSWALSLDPRAIPAIAAAARGARVVQVHDAHALRLAGWALRGSRPLVAVRRVAFPLRHAGWWARAARVVAVSEAVRAQLIRDGIDPIRVVTIPSAVDAEAIRAGLEPGALARLGLPPGSTVAAVAAALTPEKGHRVLLTAAALLRPRHPDLHWVMAGEGRELAGLMEEAARLGVADRVHWPGRLQDAPSLLAEADVAVVPSLSEGLGTSALEALAVGTPLVATAAGGLAEVLSDGAGLGVPPGDAAALAEAVHRVLSDPALCAQLAAQSALTLSRHEPGRMARAVLEVYASVTGTGRTAT